MLRMEFFDPETQPVDDVFYEPTPTKGEIQSNLKLIGKLGLSLLQANPNDLFELHYLRCCHDRIEWLGQNHKGACFPSAPIALMDFTELGNGVLPAISAQQLHSLLFGGPNKKMVVATLNVALLWEQDRVKNGEKFNVHDRRIGEHLGIVVNEVRDYYEMVTASHRLCSEQ